MITGSVKSQVDRVWDAFWSGGISNPISVIEQFTYLLFMKQLDDRQARLDNNRTKAAEFGLPDPQGTDTFNSSEQDLRWRNLLAETDPQTRLSRVRDEVFPFLKNLGDDGFSRHLRDASLLVQSPATLTTVMQEVDKLDFSNRDMGGDLYEYMLSKIASSGTNGQFRTPSHIIDLLVALMAPTPHNRVIDPACGTAGFLVGAAEWVREHHGDDLMDTRKRDWFQMDMFHGFDFDATMVRIAAMNMYMNGFDVPNIDYRDSLQKEEATSAETMSDSELGRYDVVLANPPFAGSLDLKSIDPDLTEFASTKKTELLFINRFLTLLRTGGRAAVIVPEGVLFGSTKAHKAIRKELVDNQKLDAVIKLPSGTFKPYSGVSTAILCFTKTDTPSKTKNVWFYDIRAEGYSLDDKRNPLLDAHLLGPSPTVRPRDPEVTNDAPEAATLADEQLAKNNLPDVVARWAERNGTELERARTEQSFCVPVDEIREADYDLSMNRYKEIIFEAEETRDPLEIIAEIEELDKEIAAGLADLKKMLVEGA